MIKTQRTGCISFTFSVENYKRIHNSCVEINQSMEKNLRRRSIDSTRTSEKKCKPSTRIESNTTAILYTTRCYNVIFSHRIKCVSNDTQKESKELKEKKVMLSAVVSNKS